MSTANGHIPSPAPSLNMQDIITLTARLAQVLAEEVDLLGEMKVSKIETLQQEKLFLVNALDSQRKLIAKHPKLLETIPSSDKKDLEEVVDVFNNILEENHSKLLLAKEINHRVVQAITEVVRTNSRNRVYNGQGGTGTNTSETLSITLNKKV